MALKDKLLKKLSKSDNKFLKKIGKKFKKKKIKPDKYVELCKNAKTLFKFEKKDLKAAIEEKAKFKGKKITEDFVIKDYEQNGYKKIMKVLKTFEKLLNQINDQYRKIISERGNILNQSLIFKEHNAISTAIKRRYNGEEVNEEYMNECKEAFGKVFQKSLHEFYKDTKSISASNTYLNLINFEKMKDYFKEETSKVLENYKNSKFVINEKVIENNHKIIDKAVEKQTKEISKGFNKYINELEKFKRKYKIENDSTYSVKFGVET